MVRHSNQVPSEVTPVGAFIKVLRGPNTKQKIPWRVPTRQMTLPLVLCHEVPLAAVPAAWVPAVGSVQQAPRLVRLDFKGLTPELAAPELAPDVELGVVF